MNRILIADDDPVMLKLFELNLKKQGFKVVACSEGNSVPVKARANIPDLAILDYLLPGKSGLELIVEFKNDESLKCVPIIVVTGQGKGSTKEELLAAGADKVFTKPFSPTMLISEVKDRLKSSV